MQTQDLTGAIQRRAYEIWLSEGCPHGRDQIHWLRAEAEVREEFAAAHSADHCKGGLHEKPVEARGRKQRPPRRGKFGGEEAAPSTR